MAVLMTLAMPGPAALRAQPFDLDFREAPLGGALAEFDAQADLSLVYAQRLVRERTSTCAYRGRSAEDALACLLYGTGLEARRVRRRQYVIVASGKPKAIPRGAISGFIADAGTGEVLPGAHVFLPGLRLGTTTNEAGYFAIPSLPLGAYEVRISFLGYQVREDTLRARAEGQATVALTPVALEAGGIFVEASRNDAALPPGLISIPVQQLEQLPSIGGEQDLFQALQWLPGVRRSGEVNGGLVVRGGEPDQNLFLLDGVPVYHPWHAFSLLSTFQTETFKDIKLFRGTFPAEHGGRLTSVLDAELKDGSRLEPKAIAALGVLSGRFLIESPITEAASFMVSGRRSYIDKLIGREHPVEDDSGRRDTLRTGYYFYDVSAKVTYRPSYRHRLAFSYYRGRDDLDLRLPFDVSLDLDSWLRPADLFFEVGHNWGNRLYSARYQFLPSSRFFLTATAYRSAYSAREQMFIQPSGTASVASWYRVRLRDAGVKLDVDYYHSPAHRLRVGAQLSSHRFRSGLDALIKRSADAVDEETQRSRLTALEGVLYAQDTWQPAPRWEVMPGLRASFFDGYVHLNPRLSAQYTVRPGQLLLRGGIGTQVQYLHRLRDRYSFIYDLVSSRWIPSSEAVAPSQSVQGDLGLESHPLPWLTLTAEVYARSARNVLVPEDVYRTKDGLEGPGIETGALLAQYVPAKARAYGVELAARVETGPWWVWLSYAGGRSLTRSEAMGEGRYRPASYDVPRSFVAVAGHRGRRWNATLSAEARSGYVHTVPVSRYALGDPLSGEPVRYLHRPAINNGRLPPYVRLDGMLQYQFDWVGAQWRAGLHLYNLLNHRNVIGRSYDPTQPVVQAEDRRGLPILPLLELELEL